MSDFIDSRNRMLLLNRRSLIKSSIEFWIKWWVFTSLFSLLVLACTDIEAFAWTASSAICIMTFVMTHDVYRFSEHYKCTMDEAWDEFMTAVDLPFNVHSLVRYV